MKKRPRNRLVPVMMFLALSTLVLTLTNCSEEVIVEVTRDGCITVTGIPDIIREVTVTMEGPDEAWIKKGPVTGGEWGPYYFPRGFVDYTFNKGKIKVDTIDTSGNEKTYPNKEGITLRKGDQNIKFDKFE